MPLHKLNQTRGYIFLALLLGLVLFSCFMGMDGTMGREGFDIKDVNITGKFIAEPTHLAKSFYDTDTVFGETDKPHELSCGLYSVLTDHGFATAYVYPGKITTIEFHFHNKHEDDHRDLPGKTFAIQKSSKNDDDFAKMYEKGCSSS
jgi:hypothetical protein